MTVKLRLAPETADEEVLEPDGGMPKLVSGDFNKTHTGISDWRVRHSYAPSLFNRHLLDEIWLETDDGTLLFRGYLKAGENNQDDGTSEISGVSIADDLTNAETTRTYQNELAHEAIADYWLSETTFSATVTPPTPNATVTNNVAQSADTTSEFISITTIAGSDPVAAQNGNLELLQTGFFFEAEDNFSLSGAVSDSDASDSESERMLANSGVSGSTTFTTDYVIPAGNVEVAARIKYRDSDNDGDIEGTGFDISIDGDTVISRADIVLSQNEQFEYVMNDTISSDLSTGSHTVTVTETGAPNSDFITDIDLVHVRDNRFNYTNDNSVDGNNHLSGPELFPDAFTFAFDQESTPWNITNGSVLSTWNDVSNNQRIQLQLSGQTWFPNNGNEDNTQSITTDFGSEFGTNIRGRATLSRFGSRTTQSPTTGFKGQKINDWEITYDGNDLAVIEDQTFEGSHLQNLQDLHNFADMRFTVLHEKNSRSVESYRAGDIEKSLPSEITSGKAVNNKIRKKDLSDYANKVTVRSKRVAGTRFTTTLQDDSEVNKFGVQLFSVIVPTVDNQADTDAKCRSLLSEKLRERTDKGEIEAAPLDVAPGFSYDNQFGSDDPTVPLEETQYQVSNGSVSGRLVFDFRVTDLTSVVGGLRRDSRNIRRGL